MPTADQGMIISAKWSDINNAIRKFGGNELNYNAYYYTSSTSNTFNNCIHGSGGKLYSTSSVYDYPYARGITNLE